MKDDLILQVPSQEPPMSSKSTMEDRDVLDTLIFMLEYKNVVNRSIIAYKDDIVLPRITMSFKSPVRNQQRTPSPPLFLTDFFS